MAGKRQRNTMFVTYYNVIAQWSVSVSLPLQTICIYLSFTIVAKLKSKEKYNKLY